MVVGSAEKVFVMPVIWSNFLLLLLRRANFKRKTKSFNQWYTFCMHQIYLRTTPVQRYNVYMYIDNQNFSFFFMRVSIFRIARIPGSLFSPHFLFASRYRVCVCRCGRRPCVAVYATLSLQIFIAKFRIRKLTVDCEIRSYLFFFRSRVWYPPFVAAITLIHANKKRFFFFFFLCA